MDYALVTLFFPRLNRREDMELPARMLISELTESIILSLKKYDSGSFGYIEALTLKCDGKILNRDLTLADYRIWDGSVIEAEG
ncbi:MAG: EsaB/YukD family protein [Lachnospiraceae bacterium]|nr:EsaB/YukD family protein [Lachnospiraceae bacterium]